MEIIAIIFLILGVMLIIASCVESETGFAVLGLLCVIIFMSLMIISSKQRRDLELKIDLPEEIDQARKGDTLYILKTTRDSIYLGFKPIKTK